MKNFLLFLAVLSILQDGHASNQDCFYQPIVSECMKQQVYWPLSQILQNEKISLRDKKFSFELSAQAYAAYLLNHDTYLYNCCGKIGELLKKSAFSIKMSGRQISKTLKDLGEEVRKFVAESNIDNIDEADVFDKCREAVDNIFSKK